MPVRTRNHNLNDTRIIPLKINSYMNEDFKKWKNNMFFSNAEKVRFGIIIFFNSLPENWMHQLEDFELYYNEYLQKPYDSTSLKLSQEINTIIRNLQFIYNDHIESFNKSNFIRFIIFHMLYRNTIFKDEFRDITITLPSHIPIPEEYFLCYTCDEIMANKEQVNNHRLHNSLHYIRKRLIENKHQRKIISHWSK